MTVPTLSPAPVRSAGSQTSTASRTPSPAGTYTDWRRRDTSTVTPRILAPGLNAAYGTVQTTSCAFPPDPAVADVCGAPAGMITEFPAIAIGALALHS